MRAIAIILAIGVFIRHFTAHSIGAHTYLGVKPWFYVVGGLWEALLCAILGIVFWESGNRFARIVGLTALAIGFFESLQMSICRAAVLNIKAVPLNMNLCDYLIGLPVAATLMTLYFFIIGWLLYKNRTKKS